MNLRELAEIYFDRYNLDPILDISFNDAINEHDIFHLLLLEQEDIDDLRDNPDKDVSNDDPKDHINMIGFRAEQIADICNEVLRVNPLPNMGDIENIVQDIHKTNIKILKINMNKFSENKFSSNTILKKPQLHNKMRLGDLKRRMVEEKKGIEWKDTKCYFPLTDDEVEHYYNKAVAMRERFDSQSEIPFYQLSVEQMLDLPIEALIENDEVSNEVGDGSQTAWQDKLKPIQSTIAAEWYV